MKLFAYQGLSQSKNNVMNLFEQDLNVDKQCRKKTTLFSLLKLQISFYFHKNLLYKLTMRSASSSFFIEF